MQNAIIGSGMGAARERPVRPSLVAEQRSIVHRPCDCCDGEVACVRGVVLDGGGAAAAVYFATFVLGHDPVVRMALGEGDVTALVDLSVDPNGLLRIESAGEDVDVDRIRGLAEAIWRTDELVAAYLAAPRTSVIRAIRR